MAPILEGMNRAPRKRRAEAAASIEHAPSGPAVAIRIEQPNTSTFRQNLRSAVLRGVLLFIAWRLFAWQFLSKRDTSAPANVPAGIPCAWNAGQSADLYVYISTEPIQTRFDDSELVYLKTGIVFGVDGGMSDAELHLDIAVPKSYQADEPIFGHVYLMKEGLHPNPTKSRFSQTNSSYRRTILTGVMPRPANADATHLLQSGKFTEPATLSDESSTVDVPFWYPELHIALVQYAGLIDALEQTPLHARRLTSTTLDGKLYLPTLYLSEAWRINDRRIHLKRSMLDSGKLPLKLTFKSMSRTKFQMLSNLSESVKMNEKLFGIGGEETEKLKEMFFETNPYLLAVTLAVSVLHTLFDFLAFKNDVQFWKQTSNLSGLSVRTVMLNAAMQFIIFLYLLDQNSSWLILASAAAGTAIEAWKITRVLSFGMARASNGWPRIVIRDRETYNGATRDHDSAAMRYLTLAAIPLLVGYAFYSLLYKPQKSWYSWIIGTLVGFVYTFGFITMTPQLFINYKMKSVAHMPWRVFVYKALNTFIDDLFAFVIRMPTMHRIACFRDDFVFLIYLYQRWIYPVDRTRANEFGQVFDEPKATEPSNDNQPEAAPRRRSKRAS